ncbi:hypothetical protein H2248_001162 [Termitomyces sp. 'cryptogamus']|nr:hypothetical protein H2248_001162 [Termitomyces sp. 'cryptogamus']
MHASEDAESLLANRPYPRWQSWFAVAGKRRFIVVISFGALASLLGLSVFRSAWIPNQHSVIPVAEAISEASTISNSSINLSSFVDPLGPAANLLGPPTPNFRDNLRADRKYITSWISAGWTNDVMTYINLIYLAIITDRIPVIAMFIPSHVQAAPNVDFGLVFDVPRLRKALNIPVLEWHEVKDRNSEEVDEIGCWNTWEAVKESEDHPRQSRVTDHLKLDISYTKAPSWIKVIPKYEHDQHSYFWSLAALAFPETRAANLVPPRESPDHHVLLPPDEQMLCYDYMYYVCANQPYEMEFDYSPAWRFVGQHLHWSPRIEQLAYQYVRRTLGTLEDETIPPWIAIHVRRGDFEVYCSDGPIGCYASLDVIARRVDEVKAELLQRKGISVDHIIMTSDERDTAWWDEVKGKGWYAVDHSQTADLLGPWFPVFIDAAIQSLGAGFVGTDGSTMSMIARRRVESWTDGAVRIFKWGQPDSDDH